MEKNNLLGLEQEELVQISASLGESAFRGRQLYVQIYRRKEYDIDRMTDLAKSFRGKLRKACEIKLPEIEDTRNSEDGAAKYIFRLRDGETVEAVYIPESGRDTLCISSQAGCRVGCRFCMTGQKGFRRNLSAGEIVGQVLAIIREGSLEEKGFNVVFMGMGEPLHNYRNVMKAFRILSDPDGIGLSHRKITISTSGIVPVMREMAGEKKIPSLAVSLNAADDETRDRIMPINREWNIAELLQACRDFPLEGNRRITMRH
jgi:23S rRNA (adenine2503-C2)-methyltransferase